MTATEERKRTIVVERATEPVEKIIGPHLMRFEPPDLMRVWWRGEGTKADILAMYEFAERCTGGRRYFLVADQSKLTGVTSDARKLAAVDPRVQLVIAIAFVGASFHLRVLMTMMIKAMQVFYRERAANMRFVETEAEALAWFDAERKRLGLG